MGSRHPSQAEAFAEIAAALVQKSPDRSELAGAIEPLDGFSPHVQNLAARVSFGTALGVEQARP